MKDILEFLSNNPWLSFFLLLVIGQIVIGVFDAIFSRAHGACCKCEDDNE